MMMMNSSSKDYLGPSGWQRLVRICTDQLRGLEALEWACPAIKCGWETGVFACLEKEIRRKKDLPLLPLVLHHVCKATVSGGLESRERISRRT
jgi:hypothetical protein